MSQYGVKKNVVLKNVRVDLIIDAVRTRPALWNIQDQHFKNKIFRSSLWEEVTSEANLELNESNVLTVRKSWEMLKATYIRSKKRTSNGAAVGKKEYKHAKALSFLDDIIKPRRTLEPFDKMECCVSNSYSSNEFEDREPSTPNNTILGLNYDDEALELQRRYTNVLERISAVPTTTSSTTVVKPPDAISSFLSSLHPYLEALRMTARLEAQHKMLKVLIEALKEQENSHTNN